MKLSLATVIVIALLGLGIWFLAKRGKEVTPQPEQPLEADQPSAVTLKWD